MRAGFGFLLDGGATQPVDLFDEEEECESDNEESDEGVDEEAVVDGGNAGSLGLGEAIVMIRGEVDVQVREVYFIEGESDRWHDDIAYERIGDLGERTANDDTDGHVDHVASDGECLEFLDDSIHRKIDYG